MPTEIMSKPYKLKASAAPVASYKVCLHSALASATATALNGHQPPQLGGGTPALAFPASDFRPQQVNSADPAGQRRSCCTDLGQDIVSSLLCRAPLRIFDSQANDP